MMKNNVGTQLRNLGVTVFDCDRLQAVATVEGVLGL